MRIDQERLKERAGSCWMMMKMVLSMRTTGSVQPARGHRRPIREFGIQECGIDGGRLEGDSKA